MLADLFNPALNSHVGNIAGYSAVPTPILQLILRVVLDFIIGAAGVYFFFNIIRGGYEFITAGGDKDGLQSARRRVMNAVIGIVVILSVFAVAFVLDTLFGISITNFNIPTV